MLVKGAVKAMKHPRIPGRRAIIRKGLDIDAVASELIRLYGQVAWMHKSNL